MQPLTMAARKTSPRNSIKTAPTKAKVREALLGAARKMFARKGLNGTSIRDIANEAQVNSSMISYYFDGKENLYRECLKEIGQTHFKFTEQILQPPSSRADFGLRLKLFAENLLTLFLEDRDSGLIIIREYDRLNSPAEDIFKQGFLDVFDQIIHFFKASQKAKVIPKHQDPFVLASLFFGAFSSQMRLDHLKENIYNRSLKDKKEQIATIDTLIQLFAN